MSAVRAQNHAPGRLEHDAGALAGRFIWLRVHVTMRAVTLGPRAGKLRARRSAILEPVPPWLLGRWRLMRADPALDFAPGVLMEFRPGGELRYTIRVGDREHVITLVYSVRGDLLETDNPTVPHRTSSRIAQGAADTLVIDFSGAIAAFVRET